MTKGILATCTPRPTATPTAVGVRLHTRAHGNHSPGHDEGAGSLQEGRSKTPGTPSSFPLVRQVPPIVHDVLRSPSQPLDVDTRAFMEARFSHDFSRVRVHADEQAAESARAMHALAYTVGQDIVLGSGQYMPGTMAGQRVVAHELVHTLQQGSAGNAVQGSLIVDQSSDAAESEADRVANAVLAGARVPAIQHQPRSAARLLQRTCTVSAGSSPDQRNVDCDGQRYRVTIVIESSSRPETRVSANLGWNDSTLLLNVEICRGGTAVNVVPFQVELGEPLVRVLGNVLNGSDALEGVTITPELRIVVVQSRSYSISIGGGPTIEPGTGDVVGGRGGARVDTSAGRFELDIEGSRDTGVGPSFRYTPGDFRPETRDCSRRQRALRMRCERISVTPAVPPTPAQTRAEQKRVYLLFPYERSTPIREVLMGEDGGPASPSSASQVANLSGQGYQVCSIQGFASPEGLRTPSRRRGGFIGNQALSEDRATQAQRWLETACPACGGQAVTPVGESELFSPARTPEPEGRELDEPATTAFLESEDPLRPGSEAERQRLSQAPLRAQRDAIYPRLRRAVIVLERTVTVTPARPGTPERQSFDPVGCPQAVREAIRQHFGIRII